MKILYSPRFLKAYKRLPEEIKDKIIIREELIKEDIFNPKLKTHKLSGEFEGYYAFSVDYKTRIIFIFAGADIVRLELIGGHDIY